jgi:outer membrane protein assembly factor BamA
MLVLIILKPHIKIPLCFKELIMFVLLYLICSCNPTKYIPEGETLLAGNHVNITNDGISKNDIVPYIRQKPNKKIFGARFHLGLYNLSDIEKQKWPHGWLREIGEEPVIYDAYAKEKSKENIMSYIASRGHFDSQVTDTVQSAKRKSDVYYNIKLRPPYTIRNLFYEIEDTTIRKLFYFDSVNCMIERGKPYDVEVLSSERLRFERFIRDRGFYSFSGEHIYFNIDSTIGNRQVDIYYGIKNFMIMDASNRITLIPHPMYRVKDVYIYPDFVPREALERGEDYFASLDTINYQGYYFITASGKPEIKYDLIIQSLYIRPGSIFNVSNTQQSQSHLLALKTFRLVNIFYDERNETRPYDQEVRSLNCNIRLTLLNQQSFRVEVEGTNSEGNLGGAVNFVYLHKNLFRGAEQFNLRLKGAYETLTKQELQRRSTQEYGVETSLQFPKFLLPFLKKEDFIRRYNPTTKILAAYNYQNMPFYIRTMANATFGYTWNARNYQTHIVNPLQVNAVRLLSIDSAFQKQIESSSYLAYSYRDVMIIGGNYSLIFNNQMINRSRYWFFRFNAEAAGNILAMAGSLLGADKEDGSYSIFGQQFAQYIRTDIDLRYNLRLNDASSVVWRGFIGAGIPYGNSKAIPFEKQYFGGGANGIRAWQVRSLGPGAYNPSGTRSLNQTADIKIEANAEYRFKLFWILEGALFLDAGNIWNIYADETMPGSQFRLKGLYRDIAVGTGTGFRFDFNFVIGRIDLGMKLRDPSIAEGSRWIIMNRNYNFRNDFTLVVAIGYPF